jgi:hypothetical protein
MTDGINLRLDVSREVQELFRASRALRNQGGTVRVDIRLNRGDCAVVLTVDAPKGSLLAGLASWLPTETLRAFTLESMSAEVANNVVYIRRLEMGHQKQKPYGWIRGGILLYGRYLREELQRAIAAYPNDPRRAIQAGIDSALLRIQAYLVKGTARVSGRAAGAWIVRRQDGALSVTSGRAASSSGRGVLTKVVQAAQAAAEELTQ